MISHPTELSPQVPLKSKPNATHLNQAPGVARRFVADVYNRSTGSSCAAASKRRGACGKVNTVLAAGADSLGGNRGCRVERRLGGGPWGVPCWCPVDTVCERWRSLG